MGGRPTGMGLLLARPSLLIIHFSSRRFTSPNFRFPILCSPIPMTSSSRPPFRHVLAVAMTAVSTIAVIAVLITLSTKSIAHSGHPRESPWDPNRWGPGALGGALGGNDVIIPKEKFCFNALRKAAARLPQGTRFKSLIELAKAVGKSRKTLSRWCKGINYKHPDWEMEWRIIFSNHHARKQLTFLVK